ncbi:hypothetical protein GF312_06170 [Candidatus Poribacteria bacterium]|nr:hypothetical protein [Candidatus Poribacteria bacterium]
MEPVKLGIIGCGVIGTSHASEASKSPLVDLVAVADLIKERADGNGEKFGASTIYYNDTDLINDDRIEAVTLAMPVWDRTPVAFKALEKGKHVIIEKPAAANCGDIEKMINLRGDKVVACCSPRMAFTGHAEAARKCVATGVLGKIRSVRFRIVLSAAPNPNPNPPPWRQSMKLNGGGILVNWSCYDLNYMMHILDWQLKPQAVMARWWPVGDKMSKYVIPNSDADSHYTAFITCEDGVVLTMERGEFTSATTDQAWEIIGSDATLHLPMKAQKGKPNAVILDKFIPGEGVVSETIWEEGDSTSDNSVLKNFVYAVREGKKVETSLEQALVMQKITDGIYESNRIGQSVAIA